MQVFPKSTLLDITLYQRQVTALAVGDDDPSNRQGNSMATLLQCLQWEPIRLFVISLAI